MPQDVQNFTSWKLDAMNALVIYCTPSELRVALLLLQHANQNNKAIFPSQRRLATILGCDVKTIERGIKGLVKKGLLTKIRPRRNRSNRYAFNETKISEGLAEYRRRDARARAEWEPTKISGPKKTGPDNSVGSEPDNFVCSDRTNMGGKHLKGTPAVEYLKNGIDPELPAANWTLLLLFKLCDDVIDGFGVAKPSRAGRHKDRWSTLRQLTYIRDIEKISMERNCSDKNAVKAYLTKPGKRAPSSGQIASGQARLSEARNKSKNPFCKMIPPQGHPNRMSALEGLIEVFESMKNY
jgi:DNA-binding MarR family transcriptional regulator